MFLVAWSVFAFAGVYAWTTLPVLAGALVMTARVRPAIAAPETRVLDICLLAGLAWGALQAVTLPGAVRDWLSPGAGQVDAMFRVGATGPPPSGSISVDPVATINTVVLGVALLLIFFCCRDAFHEGGLRRMARAISWIGLALVLETIVQVAVSPKRIYGFWVPFDPGTGPFGPFVNRNHLASWLLMALSLSVGYDVARFRAHGYDQLHQPQIDDSRALSRGLWLGTSGILMAVGLLVTLSRSGVMAMLVVLTWGGWIARRKLGRTARNWILAIATLALVVATAYVNLGAWLTRLDETLKLGAGGRPAIWKDTLHVIDLFPLTGVGVGAYGTAMVALQQADHVVYFNQAHNEYLQTLAEGGLLLAVPLVIAMASFVLTTWNRLDDEHSSAYWIRLGAVMGLGGLAFQGIWETGLRTPANAVLAAVLAAMAVHKPRTG